MKPAGEQQQQPTTSYPKATTIGTPSPRATTTGPAARTAGRSYLQATKGETATMETYPGDPHARPELAVCAISATGAIKRKRESIIGKAAVCWLSSNSHDSEPHHVADALDEQLRISRHEIKVVKHYPEQYLVFFTDSQAFQRAVNHLGVRSRGRTFNFEPWTERCHAVEKQLEFRVRLRIEGLPAHAWSEEVAGKIIGQHCAIHYVERHSRRQDRTRTYDLWAWSSNPSKIPKIVLFTITDPDRELASGDDVELFHDPPRGYKGAFVSGTTIRDTLIGGTKITLRNANTC